MSYCNFFSHKNPFVFWSSRIYHSPKYKESQKKEKHLTKSSLEQWAQDLENLKEKLEWRQKLLNDEVKNMAIDLTQLTQQVAATATVEASAVTLINAIVTELMASANDPVKVAELAAQLKVATDPLAAAIAANPIPAANTP